jgi:Leucine-rich repeat (LRR) protein
MVNPRGLSYSMLPKNKYSRIYIEVIEAKRKQPKVKGLTESHHIFPKCLFGESDLVINATFREHYLLHLLLYKAYKYKYSDTHKWVVRLGNVLKHYNKTKAGLIIKNSRQFSKARLDFLTLTTH